MNNFASHYCPRFQLFIEQEEVQRRKDVDFSLLRPQLNIPEDLEGLTILEEEELSCTRW